VGDAGLEKLAGAGLLEELHLNNTKVTHNGLAHLSRLPASSHSN
jgi:hypothetical protein